MSVDGHVAALVLDEIATLLSLGGANRFKVRAYRNAARAIDAVDGDLREMLRNGELANVRGIGDASMSVVRELLETGASRLLERLQAETPSGIVEMLEVPGLGATKIATLHEKLGVDSLAELEAAARDGRVAKVRGFGPKTVQRILDGIEYVRGAAGRRILLHADEAAIRLVGALRSNRAVVDIRFAGELRRRCETVDGVDLVVAADRPAKAREAVAALPGLRAVSESGDVARAARSRPHRAPPPDVTARLADGFAVRAWCVPPAAFPTAVLFATGSEAHVAALARRAAERGLELRSDALLRDGEPLDLETEADVYDALGLDFVAPELREEGGEVALAAEGALPELVTFDRIRGTFHTHTVYSDGAATVDEMAEAAHALGWRYLGISDHSKAAFYAGGLERDELERQQAEIDEWNAARGGDVFLLKGVEADILADGRVDYSDEPGVLDTFDFVIVSVHSHFRMGRDAMTDRVTRALADPRVRILGHATGRLLLSREGYDVDIDAVLEAAAEHDIVVELNCDPKRMELDWRLWRRAKELGIRCAINPDAHSTRGLDNVRWGVDVIRKAGLGPDDIVNTWELERVRDTFARAGD